MDVVNWRSTPLSGLYEVQLTPTGDPRGHFTRLFCEQELAAIRPGLHFTQVNHSETRGRGTIRGMHFQAPPAAEAKLIRCLRGRVHDVVVDVRTGSPTFLHWHAIELAGDNDRAIFIPEGFAHGFLTLSDTAIFTYLCTAPYDRDSDCNLLWDDPQLAIDWPLADVALSGKDTAAPLLAELSAERLPVFIAP